MIPYRAAIIITIAVLAAAAILIFWKAGEYTRGRFVRLCAGNLLIHLADGFITYVNTPGLEREGNFPFLLVEQQVVQLWPVDDRVSALYV